MKRYIIYLRNTVLGAVAAVMLMMAVSVGAGLLVGMYEVVKMKIVGHYDPVSQEGYVESKD
jgi:hypothetical protein